MKLKVAICDDEIKWINTIKERLKAYKLKNDISFDIFEFVNPNDLLKSYKRAGTYDILFLDMEMPIDGELKKGFNLAKKIRSIPDEDLRIIFFSNYPQYMNLGYDVHASQYLQKSVSVNNFFSVLDNVISDMTKDASMIRIKTEKDNWTLIRISDIIYVNKPYSVRDNIIYCTLSGQLSERKTINTAESELAPYGFAIANKFYLVNFKHIIKFSRNRIIMDNGEEINLSRRFKQDFHNRFSHNILTIER